MNIGTKFQTFEGEERKVYRLIKFKNDSIVVLQDVNSGQNKIIGVDILKDKFVEIESDALLDIMITSYDNGDNDIYVCLYKKNDIASNNNMPVLILRQDVYSYSKNAFGDMSSIYVGECVTEFDKPSELVNLVDICEFSKVDSNLTLEVYVNDTEDDIIKLVNSNNKFNKDIESVLTTLSKKNTDIVKGYAKTFKELLDENHFMYSFRYVYNITQVDWPVDLGSQSHNADGDIILNSKQHKILEDILRQYITDIKVIEYDHDIDVADIVSSKHIMLSDVTGKIYLIAYTKTGDYPVDDDIARAMNVNNN